MKFSESFWKLILETSLMQNCLMGYIYFGLDLTLARSMHTRRRCQCKIQSHCAIFLGNWLWKVLNVIERDRSLFCPFSYVQDRYLCVTLSKCAVLGDPVVPKEILKKHHRQRRRIKRKTTVFRFNTRYHKGKVKKIKHI